MLQMLRKLWNPLGSAQAESTAPPTRIVVGLGNPGSQYESTRHNVGFRVLDLLAERHGAYWRSDGGLEARVARVEIADQRCLLVQPQTFMNRSGATLLAALNRWPSLDPARDVLIVYDDLDLPIGRIRLRPSGGPGGHRGMADILRALDTQAIARLRFGIGHPGASSEVIDWVLCPFTAEDEQVVLPDALARAAEAIESSLGEGLTAAMGQFNASP